MFRLTCFVDDKKLSKVKWLLHGHVYNLIDEPVINVRKTAGAVRARTPSGKRAEMFAGWLHKQKLSTVRPADVQRFCEDVGMSTKSYSIVLTMAIRKKLLRRIGDEFRYEVIRSDGGKSKKKKTAVKRRRPKLRVVKPAATATTEAA